MIDSDILQMLAKADERLKSARVLSETHHYNDAVSRCLLCNA